MVEEWERLERWRLRRRHVGLAQRLLLFGLLFSWREIVVVQERLDHLGQGKSWNVFLVRVLMVTNVERASLQMRWEVKLGCVRLDAVSGEKNSKVIAVVLNLFALE